MTGHLVIPIVGPLGAAVLCLLFHRSPRGQRLVSLATFVGIVIYLAGWLWPTLWARGVAVLCLGNWPAPYGIVLAADLFSAIMVSLSAVVGLVVLVYAMAWFRHSQEERALRAGAASYMTKPFSVDDLLAAVQKALDG